MICQDLILEIQTEELPAKVIPSLTRDFRAIWEKKLKAEFFSFETLDVFSTPRRIAIQVQGLSHSSEPQMIRKKGPPVKAGLDVKGQPTSALIGFLKQNQITQEALFQEETPKGAYFYCEITPVPQKLESVIGSFLEHALKALNFEKTMRWGKPIQFPRPIRSFWAMYGHAILEFACCDIGSVSNLKGHPVHHPLAVQLKQPRDYVLALEQASVCVNPETRRERVFSQINALADQVSGVWLASDELISEITHITEWPQAVLGEFDPDYLVLPKELILCVLTNHQRYIALVDPKTDRLLPKFIAVANIESTDPQHMIRGYERVLTARLSDALYFYNQDLKTPLSSRVPTLSKMVQHQAIGTLADQQNRVAILLRALQKHFKASLEMAQEAAQLSKCDLATHVVQEFPELHGIIGARYVASSYPEIAQALEDSILPVSFDGALPQSDLGRALALADKVDTLTGMYALSKPSSTQDPFGLRRLALAIMRILIAYPQELDLKKLFEASIATFPDRLQKKVKVDDLLHFCFERLRAYWVEQGFKTTLFSALVGKTNSPHDLLQRLTALEQVSQEPQWLSLVQLNKRLKNILKDTDLSHPISFDACDLVLLEEKDLYEVCERLEDQLKPLLESKNYVAAFGQLLMLEVPLAQFFEVVLVMDPDLVIRNRRIGLLARIYQNILKLADLSGLG